ncbi:MAG: biotin synthase BioB [Acutalibacteraceae bacterium]
MVNKIYKKIINGGDITKEEALYLIDAPLSELCEKADKIRKKFCGDGFNRCSIINGKSGLCSENCAYCAQSAHFCTGVDEYGLLTYDQIYPECEKNAQQKLDRFAIVTSGKRLPKKEIEELCKTIKKLNENCDIKLCASLGLLSYEEMLMLKDAGVTRYHNNLETSGSFFPNICTSHTYEEKIETVKNALKAGLSVCCGGIIGLGETFFDRIDMAFTIKSLSVTSIPINILQPVKGTPLENMDTLSEDEVKRTVAVFRFIFPKGDIRLAGGRGLLEDKGKSVFRSGANSAISGDLLTYAGINSEYDRKMLKEIGYKIRE